MPSISLTWIFNNDSRLEVTSYGSRTPMSWGAPTMVWFFVCCTTISSPCPSVCDRPSLSCTSGFGCWGLCLLSWTWFTVTWVTGYSESDDPGHGGDSSPTHPVQLCPTMACFRGTGPAAKWPVTVFAQTVSSALKSYTIFKPRGISLQPAARLLSVLSDLVCKCRTMSCAVFGVCELWSE